MPPLDNLIGEISLGILMPGMGRDRDEKHGERRSPVANAEAIVAAVIVKGADDPGVDIAVSADAGNDEYGVGLIGGNGFGCATGG